MKNENYPIHFVVTWVDGNDPVWQAEKANAAEARIIRCLFIYLYFIV